MTERKSEDVGLENRQYESVRRQMMLRAAKDRGPGYRHVWLIEEFLETSTRWDFCPNETPHHLRSMAENRVKVLESLYPWALFRVSHAVMNIHVASGWKKKVGKL